MQVHYARVPRAGLTADERRRQIRFWRGGLSDKKTVMKTRIIILGAVVLLVIAAWAGGWYFFAGQIRQQVEALAFADGETSPQLSCAELSVSGFPFAFDVECSGASIVSGDLLVEIPGIRASALAYRPNHILASALGPARLADAFTGQRSAVAWTGLEASLRLENGRIARLSLVGRNVDWTDSLFGDAPIAGTPHVEAHLLDMPEAHDPDRHLAALAVFLRAEALEAPGLSIAGADAEIEAEITGLPDDVGAWGAVPFLPAWQQAGGVLRIVGIRASDETARLDASGEMALDAQGYPAGTLNIQSTGVAERIGPMIEEPWRTLVLGVPGADGSHTNQINFHGGAVSSGLVPIGAVPPLF